MAAHTPELTDELEAKGYARLAPEALHRAAGVSARQLSALAAAWKRLPADRYLRDGGRYRYRRHGCFILAAPFTTLEVVPRRAHWQPTTYNALHGGLTRWFEPLELAFANSPTFHALLRSIGRLLGNAKRVRRWHIEAHQFRIDPREGIGRPTPEGAHRDGVDFVAIVMMGRAGLRGGETRVFDSKGDTGVRFTMRERGATLLLDDRRVIHETTPIQPLKARRAAHRDTRVRTFRARGFLAPRSVKRPKISSRKPLSR